MPLNGASHCVCAINRTHIPSIDQKERQDEIKTTLVWEKSAAFGHFAHVQQHISAQIVCLVSFGHRVWGFIKEQIKTY